MSKLFRLPIVAAMLVASLCGGCMTAINSGHIVSVTERGFGIIVAQSTQNETPEVKLGFFSSAVVLEPTVTNAVLTAPNFANTFTIDQNAMPFTFGVNETIASGNYQTGNSMGSNPVAAQPLVPSTTGAWPVIPPANTNSQNAAQSALNALPTSSVISSITNAVK